MNEVASITPRESLAAGAGEIHRHYLVYGQRLCSSLPLPELPRASFQVRDMAFGHLPDNGQDGLLSGPARLVDRRSTNLDCDLSVYESGEGFLLRWEGLCDYQVSGDGRDIQCQPGPGVSLGWTYSILYGTVLPFALHLRGVGNLHASAVALPAGAVGFLAEPGTGKSTLAASFAHAGFPFLTDDVLALQEHAEGWVAYPGFPFISLSPHTADRLLEPSADLARSPLNEDKQRIAIDEKWASFCSEPIPLQGLFVLTPDGEGAAVRLKRLPRVEAVRVLLEHTNCLPFLPIEVQRAQMAFAARLAASVPVWRLVYPTGFEHASRVIPEVLRQTASASNGHEPLRQAVEGVSKQRSFGPTKR